MSENEREPVRTVNRLERNIKTETDFLFPEYGLGNVCDFCNILIKILSAIFDHGVPNFFKGTFFGSALQGLLSALYY